MTHSEAKNPTRPHARPHTRSHPVRTVRILRPLASTPTHRGADGAAVCIPLWDRRVASKNGDAARGALDLCAVAGGAVARRHGAARIC